MTASASARTRRSFSHEARRASRRTAWTTSNRSADAVARAGVQRAHNARRLVACASSSAVMAANEASNTLPQQLHDALLGHRVARAEAPRTRCNGW
jgi:hypothetical protein